MDLNKSLISILKLQRATYIDERKAIYSSSSYQRMIRGSRLNNLNKQIEDIELKIQQLQTKVSN